MRILPILTAAAIGLVATLGVANAQATNTEKKSGAAPTMANTQDSMSKPAMKSSKKMKKSKKKSKKMKRSSSR